MLLLYVHVCAKDAVFDCDAIFTDFLRDVFIELLCTLGLFSMAKIRAIATAFAKGACK